MRSFFVQQVPELFGTTALRSGTRSIGKAGTILGQVYGWLAIARVYENAGTCMATVSYAGEPSIS